MKKILLIKSKYHILLISVLASISFLTFLYYFVFAEYEARVEIITISIIIGSIVTLQTIILLISTIYFFSQKNFREGGIRILLILIILVVFYSLAGLNLAAFIASPHG